MPFSGMIDDLFNHPAMSSEAVWSGVADPVRVIRGRPPMAADGAGGFRLSSPAQLAAARVDVRVGDVPSPEEGQTVTLGGLVYPVLKGAELDDLGLVWAVPLGKGVAP